MPEQSRTLAVLGPTNTGKTHFAVERMLGYRTGVIGLPLRLLAREVYDRIVALRGPSVVALLTGEERIVPPRPRYWVCTVEAMPEGMGADFVAVDEIQLCADPERGHVFTDRLLRMRGLHETQFLGSHTMRATIAALLPGVTFLGRERMSQLAYTGPKKIARMPPRSAIVGFSVENVYAMAELIRRQKGGAAVVMGALSPRTRNAQVALYQNGDVDHLVATDAIGMGLNLDIDHVAFSSLTKFDGRRTRPLRPNELGQIAGRAGRGMRNGSFGVTGEAPDLGPDLAEAIAAHRFTPIRKLEWRNARLAYGSVPALVAALEARPEHELLVRAREADDLAALKALADVPAINARARDARAAVRLLWDVCRVPDFRGLGTAEHAALLERLYCDLHDRGRVPEDWLARQVARIDRPEGDIDTLSRRLAGIRTWTYVAQRKGWVDDENHWREATRAVEDRLSDALHGALTQRFVDRRTSVLMRRLKQKEVMVADVNDTGDVTVEGEFVGRLEGFRFRQDRDAAGQEAKAIAQASLQALRPHFHLRADRFYSAPDTQIDFTDQGGLMWGEQAVGRLQAGDDPLKPRVVAFVDEVAGEEVAQKVQRRLQHFIDRRIATLFEPLLNIRRDEAMAGPARGFGYRLVENFGIIPRGEAAAEVRALDQQARGQLRRHGVRFGQFTVFMPLLLKPAPTRLRLLLWALAQGLEEFPEAPPPGLVTVPAGADAPPGYFAMAGYRAAGERAIRIDMLERLADMLRAEDSRAGFEAKPDMLSITGMTLEQFAGLMQGLGYRAERGEREKVRPVDVALAQEPAMQAGDGAEVPPETGGNIGEGAGGADADTAGAVSAVPGAADAAGDAVADAAAQVPDAGAAPVAADPPGTEGGEAAPPPGTDADDLSPGTPADDPAPETEVFYSFTWAPRGKRGRGDGPARDAPAGASPTVGRRRSAKRDQPHAGKPDRPEPDAAKVGREKSGKKKAGDDRKPRKGKPRETGPRTFSARPERKQDRIDPDNPFAAALMGWKDKE